MEVIESYRFDGITLNEAIPSVDARWADGTQLHVTPLGLRLTCSDGDPALLDGDGLLNSAAWDEKYRDASPVLELTDGTEVSAVLVNGQRYALSDAARLTVATNPSSGG